MSAARRLWLNVVVLIVLFAASGRSQAPDPAGLDARVREYYAALNRQDVQAALGVWRPDEAERMAQSLAAMLKSAVFRWDNVTVVQTRQDGTRAQTRIGVDRVHVSRSVTTGAPPVEHVSRQETFLLWELVAGAWMLTGEKSIGQDLAERMLRAPDADAADALAAAERDVERLSALGALIGLGGQAAARTAYENAEHAFTTARRLAEREQDQARLAQALSGLGQVFAYRKPPDYAKAIDAFQQAIAIEGRLENVDGVATNLLSLANAQYASGDYGRALDSYERSFERASRAGSIGLGGSAELGTANVQYLFGQYDLALKSYDNAQKIFDFVKSTTDQARALQGVARVHVATGDYARASAALAGALRLLDSPAFIQERSGLVLELGRVAMLRGRLDEARTEIDDALALDTKLKSVFGQGRAHLLLASLARIKGDRPAAIEACTRAIAAFESATARDGVSRALLARGLTRIELKELDAAWTDLVRSAEVAGTTSDREGVARARLAQARIQTVRGRTAEAKVLAQQARELAERLLVFDVEWQAWYELGRTRQAEQDLDGARQAFERATQILEASRLDGISDGEVRTPAARVAPYVALLEIAREQGRQDEALTWAEHGRRRIFEDLLQPFRFHVTGLTSDQRVEERRLLNTRITLIKQLQRERDRATPDAARVASLEQGLADARKAYAAWTDGRTADAPLVPALRAETRWTSLDALAPLVPDDLAIVAFSVGDEQTTAFVVSRPTPAASVAAAAASEPPVAETIPPATPSVPVEAVAPVAPPALQVSSYVVPIGREALSQRVWTLTDGLVRGADTVEAQQALATALLGPARAQLQGRARLAIIPDAALWALPFEALLFPDSGRFVVQDHAVTYVPSLAAWIAAASAAAAERASRDPAAMPTRVPLVLARAEVSDVSPLHSSLTFDAAPAPAPVPPSASAPASDAASADAASANDAASADPQAAEAPQAKPDLARPDPETPHPATPHPATPNPATADAWELFGRSLLADVAVAPRADLRREHVTVDSGRLGAAGVAWSFHAAGVPRLLIGDGGDELADTMAARPSSRVTELVREWMLARLAADETRQPKHWAVWQLIGPPEP